MNKSRKDNYKDLFLTLEDVRSKGIKNLKNKIRKERSSAKTQSIDTQLEVRKRSRFIDTLERSLGEDNIPPKSVFISYSGSSEVYLTPFKKLLEEAGYEVHLGFDRIVQKGDLIQEGIISQIRLSTFFIGIWAPEFRGENIPRDIVNSTTLKGTFPSVWLPFELGIAIEARKPFKLLIDRSIHKYFYEKPYGDVPHIAYDKIDYLDRFSDCIEWLEDKYNQIIEPELNSMSW